jgi:hypothetical protein
MRYFHDIDYINLKKLDNEKRYRLPPAPIMFEILNAPKTAGD